MATLYMSPVSLIVQYLNNLGVLEAGVQLTTILGGTVNTPLPTFTDSTGVNQNPNPMTLSGAARPVSASGAPVAFWHPSGVTCTLLVQSAVTGQTLVTIPNIPAINDPAGANSLQGLLANPAQFSGVDLVANAMKSYAIVGNVQASQPPVLASGQTLIICIEGGTAVGDGLGGLFYWLASSTDADDGGVSTIAVQGGGVGRFKRWSGAGVAFFTATIQENTNNNTGLMKYRLASGFVHLWVDNDLLVPSTGNALSITNLPAALRPSTARSIVCSQLQNNSVVGFAGEAIVNTAGTVTLNLLAPVGTSTQVGVGTGNAWSTSGTKGLKATWSLTYGL